MHRARWLTERVEITGGSRASRPRTSVCIVSISRHCRSTFPRWTKDNPSKRDATPQDNREGLWRENVWMVWHPLKLESHSGESTGVILWGTKACHSPKLVFEFREFSPPVPPCNCWIIVGLGISPSLRGSRAMVFYDIYVPKTLSQE